MIEELNPLPREFKELNPNLMWYAEYSQLLPLFPDNRAWNAYGIVGGTT